MFETAEVGNKLDKQAYKERVPELREQLLEAQRELLASTVPAIILFAGVDGAGKHETVNVLNEWLDPRATMTRAYGAPTEEEANRPEYWRYWRDLPPRGQIGLFLSAWYSRPLLDYVKQVCDEREFEDRLRRAAEFERTLADDGALILKFWMHLDRKRQKKRLKKLEADPLTQWQVKPQDWEHWKLYDRFVAAAKTLIARTSTGDAPWLIIEGYDHRYRSLTVATHVRDAIERHLRKQRRREALRASARDTEADRESNDDETDVRFGRATVLSTLAMDKSLSRRKYSSELKRLQQELALLQQQAIDRRVSTILAFEGWDASGKGGSIRRVIQALDARHYRVISIASPSDEERAHHYLWRFWRHLPRAGRVTIFDRSWYGRVLVERIEGFASEPEWRRAYAEINRFETALCRHGIVLCKFWLHITPDEQLRRFEERKTTPYKHWKLTDEDWRNRERWDEYEVAVDETIAATSTAIAPWTLVEANQKHYARIKVLRTVCERLASALD